MRVLLRARGCVAPVTQRTSLSAEGMTLDKSVGSISMATHASLSGIRQQRRQHPGPNQQRDGYPKGTEDPRGNLATKAHVGEGHSCVRCKPQVDLQSMM